MTRWVVLAIVAQLADAGVSCYALSKPHRRELNPLLPTSCAGQVGVKAAALTPLGFLHGRDQTIYAAAMLGSGVVGVTLTVVLTK